MNEGHRILPDFSSTRSSYLELAAYQKHHLHIGLASEHPKALLAFQCPLFPVFDRGMAPLL